MRAVMMWCRLDMRRRSRSLAVLVLLIAIAAGTVFTALAGARRQASALSRLNAQTRPATAAVLANIPGFDWGRVASLPEVSDLALFGPSFAIDGLPDSAEADVVIGDTIMRDIERPVAIEGRNLDTSRLDEAVMTRSFASTFHRHVGDRIEVVLPTPAELQAQEGSGPGGAMTGPRLSVRLVGIVVSPWFRDEPGQPGGVTLSPAVAARFPLNTVGDQHDPKNANAVNAMVRLRGGQGAIAKFRSDVGRVSGHPDIEIWNLDEQFGAPLQRQASFEAFCVFAFAVAALIAALVLIGQAVTRFVAGTAPELVAVEALGMTRRQAVLAASMAPLGAGVVGGLLGALGAVLASRVFPFGAALLVEPSPGIAVDWIVVGPGLAVTALLVGLGAGLATRSALRAAHRDIVVRRSAVATASARMGLPVPVVMGIRLALEGGRGRGAVPVRPAIAGAIAGVLGVLAALTFGHAVSDVTHHPERFGQTFDTYAWMGNAGYDFVPSPALRNALEHNPSVVGYDDARVGVATGPRGIGSVTLYSYTGGSKPLGVVITAGRLPHAANEVMLGKLSLQSLHTAVGRTVALTTTKGTQHFLVTGSGLVPNGPHNRYADGGWLTDAGYSHLFDGFKFHLAYVTLRPGAPSLDALTASIVKTSPGLKNLQFQPPDPLSELTELRQVRLLPALLAIFLAVLAVGAVGHALASAVRLRALDIAVLRTLGMTQRQCRWVVVTHGTVLALVGIVFGVPLGIALGRTVWRFVADYTPLQYVPPAALGAFLVVPAAALLIANVLAAWAGRRAAHMRIATVLRAE